MGGRYLNQILQALKEAGLRAERGYPGRGMPQLTGPVAAVNLDRREQKEWAVGVQILSPGALGAAVCEEAALTAFRVLEAMGGSCLLTGIRTDTVTDLLRMELVARFTGSMEVILGSRRLQYVREFSVLRQVTKDITDIDGCPWELTLEEYFPAGAQEEEGPGEPFSLEYGGCRYLGCRWTRQERICDGAGILQRRKARGMRREFL